MPTRVFGTKAAVLTCALAVAIGTSVRAEATKPGFKLTKGRGVDVCEAYLDRLNTTQWAEPPYCGRPEAQQPSPFTTLNRMSLTPDEAFQLLDRVFSFTFYGDQDSFSKDNAALIASGLKPRGPLLPFVDLKREMSANLLRAWTYSPPIDIDNDGAADRVVIWHGIGAANSDNPCGEEWLGEPYRQVQIALVMEKDSSRIDYPATRRVFGHPKAGEEPWGERFMPVGSSIGILQYHGTTYFDTFLDSPLGDANGDRRTDKSLRNRIALFVASDSVTKQVCEVRWTSSERQPSKATLD